MPKPLSPDERSQADKFRDLARELECDEDEKAFEETVKRVAAPRQKNKEQSSPDSTGEK